MASGENWTEDEIIVACYIYLSRDRITVRDTRFLAGLFDRTEKSVGAKIYNIRRFDDEVVRSGGSFWSHGSHLDEVVWNKFQEDPETMSTRAMAIMNGMGADEDVIRDSYSSSGTVSIDIGPGMERYVTVKERMNQGSFRRVVLRCSDYRCCVTGIRDTTLLVASHIKPWSECGPGEKTDIHNAFCLNSLHDRLFDRGLMTVDRDLRILYAPSLARSMDAEVYESMIARFDSVKVTDSNTPSEDYLRHHNALFERRNGILISDL